MSEEGSAERAEREFHDHIPFWTNEDDSMIELEGSIFLHSAEIAGLPEERREELQQLFDEFQVAVYDRWATWHDDGLVSSPFPERMSRHTFVQRFLLNARFLDPDPDEQVRW